MCRDKNHSGRRCPGQTSRPHRRAATALLNQEAGLEPVVSAQIYRAIASDVARTVSSGITASKAAIAHITQQIRSHIMTSNTLTDAQKRHFSDRITRRMSSADTTTRQVTIWGRVLDALRKVRTAGVAVGVTAVLAACGGGVEPTDYVTPTVAPSSTSSGAPVEETPAREAPVIEEEAPLGISPSSIQVPSDTPWGEQQMSTAVADTMETVEVAQSLVDLQRPHDATDIRLYEPLRQHLTAEAWGYVEEQVATGEGVGALVAETEADGTLVHPISGDVIDVDRVTPAVNTPDFKVVTAAEGGFADEDPRLQQEITVESTYVGKNQATGAEETVTYRKVTQNQYLPNADGGWDLDEWTVDTSLVQD